MNDLQQKFATLRERLTDYSVGQQEIIDAVCLGLVAREHVLLYGPAGCNKTATILATSALCGINGSLFSVTLNKYTAPDALLGPVSIKGLKEDRFEHKLDGYIGTAPLAFIGEVFRGNGATRVALHTVLNERYIDNGGHRVKIPLHVAFLDTNNLPAVDGDKPFYDRLLIRVPVSYLPSVDSDLFVKMLSCAAFDPNAEDPIMTFADLTQAAEQASEQTSVPDTILHEVFNLRASFMEKEIGFSDRRWKHSLNVLCASAWLRGSDMVEPMDLYALRHVLWDYPEQRDTMAELLDPYQGMTASHVENSLIDQATSIYENALKSMVGEVLVSAMVELNDLRDRVSEPQLRDRINAMLDELENSAI